VELQLSHLPAVDVFNVDLLISKLQMLLGDTVKDEDAVMSVSIKILANIHKLYVFLLVFSL